MSKTRSLITEQLHPWCQQKEAVAYCERNGIAIEAYAPLVRNQKAKDTTLLLVAKKHSVSPTHVLVRYSLQKNWIPLPKSDTPARILSNANVFNFHLDEDDMAALDDLDQAAEGAIVQFVDN